MDIIPVLDVANGIAVHARGGDRQAYEPVRSSLLPDGGPPEPLALAQAYHGVLEADRCYLADLDCLQGGPVQRGLIHDIAAFQTGFDGELLVDAGASALDGALEVLSCGASTVVVGLETLRSFAALRAIVRAAGADRVAFSVDLCRGAPMLHSALQDSTSASPMALAAQAADAGVTTLLLLDIGRVGAGDGVDLDLLSAMRRQHSSLRLLAGGGVRTRADLDRMADAGCDGALVASAIHAGRVRAKDVAALRSRPRGSQSATSVSR